MRSIPATTAAATATRRRGDADDNYRIERKLKPSFRAKGMGWDHPLITPRRPRTFS